MEVSAILGLAICNFISSGFIIVLVILYPSFPVVVIPNVFNFISLLFILFASVTSVPLKVNELLWLSS